MSSANGRSDILTSSGHYFDFIQIESNEFDIQDIAYGLSRICRFTGQLRRDIDHYSVAQHSVLVSLLVSPEFALAGLLHDAAEAFLGDVSGPLKQLLPEYKAIERRVEPVVLRRFGVDYPAPSEVHIADRVALAMEQRDLMEKHDDTWAILEGISPPTWTITPLDMRDALQSFTERYEHLVNPSTENFKLIGWLDLWA